MLAATMVAGRGTGQTAWILETRAGGRDPAPGSANRPRAGSAAQLPGSNNFFSVVPGADGGPLSAESTGKNDLVHDLVGGLSDFALPLHGSGGAVGWHRHCQSQSSGNRRVDWLLCEHPRYERGSERSSYFS